MDSLILHTAPSKDTTPQRLGDIQMKHTSRIPLVVTLKDCGILEGNPRKAKKKKKKHYGLCTYIKHLMNILSSTS